MFYLADQGLPFFGHDGSSILSNMGNFLEFLDVLKNFGPLLDNHMNSANIIQGQIESSSAFHAMKLHL